jgi:hypothetical protein
VVAASAHIQMRRPLLPIRMEDRDETPNRPDSAVSEGKYASQRLSPGLKRRPSTRVLARRAMGAPVDSSANEHLNKRP